ncbi:MAG: fibronectin type III domain-containing protein [Flavobacteriales bacterium]|nr:fibronectin type III domain-containing protein [Flavobacteriales bacterium]
MTTQFTVKLGTEGLTPEEILERADAHITGLTGNADFPTPVPTLVVQQADRDALAAANVAVLNNGGKQDRLAQAAAVKQVKSNIKILAGYVQAVSGGDPIKIASAAFATRKVPQPPAPMPAPPNLRLVITTKPGELKARWGGVKDKRIYELQICDGDPLVPANWQPLVMTSRNFFLITGLVSHQAYSVRVLAVGALGVGPWSDVATTKPL